MRIEVHPFQALEDARTWGKNQIDASAGAARARHLTISYGQELTYLAKYEDSKAFLAAGKNPDMSKYPWVAKEASSTKKEVKAAAQRIKDEGDNWNFVVGPEIESQRVAGKDALSLLNSISQIVSATRAIQKLLDQI